MVGISMRATIMLLITMIFIGCQPPVPQAPKVDIVPAYVDLVTSKVDVTNDLVQEVAKALTVNTEVLTEIRDLVRNPPTSEAVAQADSPSTQSSVLASEVPTLYVSSIPSCGPCRQLERDYEKGKFYPFTVVFMPDQTWTGGYPAIRWKEGDQWKFLGTLDEKGNPVSAGYGKGTIDQLKQYHGVQ
jgi:hypothetical protein